MIDTDRFEDEVRERFEDPDRLLDRDFSKGFKSVWLFHAWLREEASLGKGTTIQYRRAVNQLINEDGTFDFENLEDLKSHERSAVKKFQYFAKTTDEEGDA